MKKLILIISAILLIMTSFKENLQCMATAKSTGMQCRNHVWDGCAYSYCYQHCR